MKWKFGRSKIAVRTVKWKFGRSKIAVKTVVDPDGSRLF